MTVEHLPKIMPLLKEIIDAQKQNLPFQQHALSLIMKAEENIPGAGIHYSIIKDDLYAYPVLSYKLQHIIRPLRYALNELGFAYSNASSPRRSIANSGIHLEGCVKDLIGQPRSRKSLGALMLNKRVRKKMDIKLINDISKLTNLAINPAKHEHISDDLTPLFQFEDALYAHFLARHFGAIILEKTTALKQIEKLKPKHGEYVQCFPGAELPVGKTTRW